MCEDESPQQSTYGVGVYSSSSDRYLYIIKKMASDMPTNNKKACRAINIAIYFQSKVALSDSQALRFYIQQRLPLPRNKQVLSRHII